MIVIIKGENREVHRNPRKEKTHKNIDKFPDSDEHSGVIDYDVFGKVRVSNLMISITLF